MRRSIFLPASIVVSFLAGSSAPTPLYSVYQAAWGFSPVTIAMVFGVYALAVLSTLLVFGSLSDHVGRRPVLFVTALLQAIAMIVFLRAESVGALVAARIVQGLATGAATSAAGAAMIDIDRDRGTATNGFAPMLGTGTGALLAGIFVQYLPAPTKLVYAVLALVFVAQAIAVFLMRETVDPSPGALASLRPRVHVPPRLRGAVLAAAPALIGAWALAGFYGSLGLTLVRTLARSPSPAFGGLAIFVMAIAGVFSVLVVRTRGERATMRFGTAALATGVVATLEAIDLGSLVLFFLGIAIAGSGFGASFDATIRSVLRHATAHERAGVLSVLYIVSYLSMGTPAIAAGVRVVHGGGIATTAREYGIGVVILALAAFFAASSRASEAPAAAPATSPVRNSTN